MELILKYLILVTEIYVSILFFISVFPTWLINQRYPCVDILLPSQPAFFLYLSQGSKRKSSVLPTSPLQGQCAAGRWGLGSLVSPASRYVFCAWTQTAHSLCTVHMDHAKGCGPVVYLVQIQHAQGPTTFIASTKRKKKMKKKVPYNMSHFNFLKNVILSSHLHLVFPVTQLLTMITIRNAPGAFALDIL